MRLVLGPLRSHFFKHFPCNGGVPAAFLNVRRLHCLSQPYFFPVLPCLLNRGRERRPTYSLLSAKSSTSSIPSVSSGTTDIQPTHAFTSPYLSVRIRCSKDVTELLSEALLCFGASSTSTLEKEEHCLDDDETCITSIFSVERDVRQCILQAANSIGLNSLPSYEVEMCDNIDWIKATQESFLPVEVTKGLWIVPEWRSPLDVDATNIILNPGLAFGTGEHPTTKLCLLLLHDLIKGGESFLDYGTGSGVLAIAALKFGAAFAVGFDIDPQAITSARYNAALNSIEPEQLLLSLVNEEHGVPFIKSREDLIQSPAHDITAINDIEKFDVVIANILRNPLLELADKIVSYAKPGAMIGLSGIISEQIPCIIKCYSEYLEGITVSELDGWACISGSKK